MSLAAVRSLAGSGGPLWGLAFEPNRTMLLIAGNDHVMREWNVETGSQPRVGEAAYADPLAEFADNPDAEAFRACVACYALNRDDGNRAGPMPHGVFSRRIASLPGYRYSSALWNVNIVWTLETVSALFQISPATYTPATRLPEQMIGDVAVRGTLIGFLQRTTTD